MVPNKVLRLFSKKQENVIDHSYIRKPYKVEWTKQHETKESNTYRAPLKFDDLDPSTNWRRHQSTPLLVDPRRLATSGYDHKRNNSDGDEWNYHKQTPSDRKYDVTLGEWLCMINVPDSDIAKQFNEAGERQIEHQNLSNDTHPEAVYTSRRYKFESLELPNIIFTKTNERRERLAVRQYMANETRLCNLKLEMIHAENSVTAAEIYEILQYL
ncbi:12713_t:CDS:2 [Racocetra persica]|uniref:12713_t:CDS:1 n=1 Tax=Racocetra persica TaxID=160502 RepID=A0ACA9KTF4_9GLOM|nr:12713_t:CDS:2 [Racocetra persica]